MSATVNPLEKNKSPMQSLQQMRKFILAEMNEVTEQDLNVMSQQQITSFYNQLLESQADFKVIPQAPTQNPKSELLNEQPYQKNIGHANEDAKNKTQQNKQYLLSAKQNINQQKKNNIGHSNPNIKNQEMYVNSLRNWKEQNKVKINNVQYYKPKYLTQNHYIYTNKRYAILLADELRTEAQKREALIAAKSQKIGESIKRMKKQQIQQIYQLMRTPDQKNQFILNSSINNKYNMQYIKPAQFCVYVPKCLVDVSFNLLSHRSEKVVNGKHSSAAGDRGGSYYQQQKQSDGFKSKLKEREKSKKSSVSDKRNQQDLPDYIMQDLPIQQYPISRTCIIQKQKHSRKQPQMQKRTENPSSNGTNKHTYSKQNDDKQTNRQSKRHEPIINIISFTQYIGHQGEHNGKHAQQGQYSSADSQQEMEQQNYDIIRKIDPLQVRRALANPSVVPQSGALQWISLMKQLVLKLEVQYKRQCQNSNKNQSDNHEIETIRDGDTGNAGMNTDGHPQESVNVSRQHDN